MEKTIVITGASGSMGSAAVKALAKKGFGVIMACRNLSKASAVRDDILREVPQAKLELAELRLDSFASIRKFARSLNDRKLYGLFNNAGVMPKDYTLTGDGYEQTIAVNYLGPFLLTHLLFPNLEGDGHVVNMVSLTCNHVKEPSDFINVRPEDYRQLHNYAISKLALMYFSIELARREPDLNVNVADPGVVNSNMIDLGRWFDPIADTVFKPLCKNPAEGALPAVNAMLSDRSMQLFRGDGYEPIPDKFLERRISSAALWEQTESIFRDMYQED